MEELCVHLIVPFIEVSESRADPKSDSGTMRKVLKWGVVPLNLEGHGMDPHSFSWARTNSPVNIRDFNHNY